MAQKIILIFQILVSLLLIAAILLQGKGEGLTTNLSEGNFFTTKKGVERLVFIITLILAFLFLLGAILNTLFSVR